MEAVSYNSLRRFTLEEIMKNISYTKHSRQCLSGLDYRGGIEPKAMSWRGIYEYPVERVNKPFYPMSGWHHPNIRDRMYLEKGN